MFQLEWPLVFVLLPLPLLVYRVMPQRARSTQAALRVPFVEDFSSGPSAMRLVLPRRHWLRWLSIMVWVLLLLAASRPQWLGDSIVLPVSGRDLVLAVDLSDSMRTTDFRIGGEQVNRLQAAKSVAADFIARRRGDRLGLVLFGTQAYLQTPLTFDTESGFQQGTSAPWRTGTRCRWLRFRRSMRGSRWWSPGRCRHCRCRGYAPGRVAGSHHDPVG